MIGYLCITVPTVSYVSVIMYFSFRNENKSKIKFEVVENMHIE